MNKSANEWSTDEFTAFAYASTVEDDTLVIEIDAPLTRRLRIIVNDGDVALIDTDGNPTYGERERPVRLVPPIDCDHPESELTLTENGYTRQWGTRIDHKAKAILATFHGSEDWGDEGDGDEYLQCGVCSERIELPEGYEIIWA